MEILQWEAGIEGPLNQWKDSRGVFIIHYKQSDAWLSHACQSDIPWTLDVSITSLEELTPMRHHEKHSKDGMCDYNFVLLIAT